MSEEALTYDSVRGAFFSAFPELLERIWNTFGSYYDLEKGTNEETPDAYPIFEDVVQKLAFELLESGQEEALLIRLFAFFESMANSPDPNVSRDLLGIAIIEPGLQKAECPSGLEIYGTQNEGICSDRGRSAGLTGKSTARVTSGNASAKSMCPVSRHNRELSADL
jgi:hypothetical protein